MLFLFFSASGLAAAGDATVCSLIGTAYRAFIIIYSVRLSVLQDNWQFATCSALCATIQYQIGPHLNLWIRFAEMGADFSHQLPRGAIGDGSVWYCFGSWDHLCWTYLSSSIVYSACGLVAADDATVCSLTGTTYRHIINYYGNIEHYGYVVLWENCYN